MTTTEQPGTDLTPQALGTWAQLCDVKARIKELAEQEEQLKATLRDQLGAGEYTVAGRPAFTISPQRKFSPDAARAVLTAQEIAACTVTVLDREAVEKILSPSRYDACRVTHGKLAVRPS